MKKITALWICLLCVASVGCNKLQSSTPSTLENQTVGQEATQTITPNNGTQPPTEDTSQLSVLDTLYEDATKPLASGKGSSIFEGELLQYATLLYTLHQSSESQILSAIVGDYTDDGQLDFITITQEPQTLLTISYYQLGETTPNRTATITLDSSNSILAGEHSFQLVSQPVPTEDIVAKEKALTPLVPPVLDYALQHTFRTTAEDTTVEHITYYLLKDTTLASTFSNTITTIYSKEDPSEIESTSSIATSEGSTITPEAFSQLAGKFSQSTPLLTIGKSNPAGTDYTNQGNIVFTLSGYGVTPDSPLDTLGKGILDTFPYPIDSSFSQLAAIEGLAPIQVEKQYFYHLYEDRHFGIYEDLSEDRIAAVKLLPEFTLFHYSIGQNLQALTSVLGTSYQRISVTAEDTMAPPNASYLVQYANKQTQLIIYFNREDISLEGYLAPIATRHFTFSKKQ